MEQDINDGPWRTVQMFAQMVPFFMIQFDRSGTCITPKTRQQLLKEAASGKFTHVVIFVHGWNNDWKSVSKRYQAWASGLDEQLSAHPPNSQVRPLLVGLFWPSTALVLPFEKAPAFAAGGLPPDISEILAELPEESAEAARPLLAAPTVNKEQAARLAEIVAPLLVGEDEVTGDALRPDPARVLELWAQFDGQQLPPVRRKFGTVGTLRDAPDGSATNATAPASATLLLDPRVPFRLGTVWLMKDRAGRVGASGVAQLLDDLLDSCSVPVHLVGHSFGARVLLSAVVSAKLSRQPTSLLLLQPAVNYLCFAAAVPGDRREGGYRSAMQRVLQPVATTYSRRDRVLTTWFHRALKRSKDLGEAVAAPWPLPPNVYAALGGYGPGEMGPECDWQDMPAAGQAQPKINGSLRIRAYNASEQIKKHGDVMNPACCWMLRNQLMPVKTDGGGTP